MNREAVQIQMTKMTATHPHEDEAQRITLVLLMGLANSKSLIFLRIISLDNLVSVETTRHSQGIKKYPQI